MTKYTKRALFYSSVVLFILVSYIVVLYAQGYKYSFSESKFFRTGSIHVRASEDANVYLGGRFLNSTSFFGNSYTISRLLPGQYKVKLERENFSSWEKTVIVEEGLVSDYSRILLLPKTGDPKKSLIKEISGLLTVVPTKLPSPSPTPKTTSKPSSTKTPAPTPVSTEPFYLKNGDLFRTVENEQEKIAYLVLGFSVSPDDKKITWWDSSNQLWVMWLKDTDYQPHKKANEKELIIRFFSKIKNVAWFRDSDHVVVEADGYKVTEVDKRGSLNIVEID